MSRAVASSVSSVCGAGGELKCSMLGLNEFVFSVLIADGNSEINSPEFDVLLVCSAELSRSALRFVGLVVSFIL
jgi:hypothetical protein